MAINWRRDREGNLLIGLVLALSALYLAYIALSIHEGIFYAGDQGIKSLEVRQIAEGYGFKYLHLPQPAWVKLIWQAGFSPLRTPSFYDSPAGYIIVFPPAFQIISAWLYEKWGTPGLYVIPMACTASLLTWFVWLLKRRGIRPTMIALALFILVFCSPLPLYGVMFWEHLPAVFLLFAGVSFIVCPPRLTALATALGLVTGLAVFLRPEALMMNLLYALSVIVSYCWDKGNAGKTGLPARTKAGHIGFLAGLTLPVFAFFIFNIVEYGSILGIHARQVLIDNDPETRMTITHGLDNLWQNNYISTRHFLVVLLMIPIVVRSFRIRENADRRPALLAGIVILFSLLTPWLLPNNGVVQWGARYFLPIIPVALVALFLAERQWNLLERRLVPTWLLCLIVVAIGYNFYHNTHGGFKEVRWRYNQRLAKTYKMVDSQPGNVVVVSHFWMINDFAWLFDKDYFFAASNNDSLSRLLPLLKKNGVRKYIFIFDPRGPTLPTLLRDSSTSHWWDGKTQKSWIRDDYDARVYTIH